MPAFRLTNVSKRYANGHQALNNINLDIEAGSFVVILGPSGAGKSTLLRALNGLETVQQGEIVFDGVPVVPRNLRQVRSGVAMVFQQFNLVGRLSVMTNVLTGRLARRSWLGSVLHLFRREDVELAARLLARVGLTERAWQRADTLSGGQQQRVGIARALAQQPKVILADEPVASLDPIATDEVMVMLADINRQDGITVILNLHQVDLAKRFADRVIGVNAGCIVFDGPPCALDRQALTHIYHREGDTHEQPLPALLAYA
ncbi:phosphate/phosphonate ABC transporter ATPase [Pseudomonas sp. M47T1]|uniref:phosphonate ABC transporter ATP-binding protein n=1 Tax=unclassified Pseudomonas TaxID=196821 RepID=UPI0002607925|nr:phosphonate ABC transporter ATP-binding protein [Pseudomonas sp. M47T1]EIK94067.1 phosphate/phosphonate ABC transporter ATPase [Pseudomonas sp. M47T1]